MTPVNLTRHTPKVLFPGTTVFTGAAPLALTDLDLSAYVGKRQAEVRLRIEKTAHTAESYYWLRTNGDTDTPGNFGLVNGRVSAVNYFNEISAITDANGIIEWYANNNDAVVITLVRYMHA
jgi:hypothetical protein